MAHIGDWEFCQLFHNNSKEHAGTIFLLLSQSRNTIGWFLKTHMLCWPIKILYSCWRKISKMFHLIWKYFGFFNRMLLSSWTLHLILVHIIVSCIIWLLLTLNWCFYFNQPVTVSLDSNFSYRSRSFKVSWTFWISFI